MKLILVFVSLAAVCDAALTQAEKDAALARHNVHRCNVRPRTADMPRMVWDTNLEAVAQGWADTCPTGHNPARSAQYRALSGSSDGVGENMAWGGYSSMAATIDSYASEKQYYTYSSNSCAAGQECGHYTQVVWAKSVRVGCAKANTNCKDWGTNVFVCNYAPAGNYVGMKPYVSSSLCIVTDACEAVGSGNGCKALCMYAKTGLLKKKGAQCRGPIKGVPCSRPAYCDGVSKYCPLNKFKADGATCSPKPWLPLSFGTCFNGVCGHPHEKICQTNIGNHGCSIPGYECVPACTNGGGTCTQYSLKCGVWINGGATFWSATAACPYDKAKTPCTTGSPAVAGMCPGTTGKTCAACTGTCPYVKVTTTKAP